jgi:hypothetical protein
MDETLLKSLLDGSYAGTFHGLKHCEKSTGIGKRWENLSWTLWSALLLWGQLAHKLSTAIHIFQNWICYDYPFRSYYRFSCAWNFPWHCAQLVLIVSFIVLHKSFNCLFFLPCCFSFLCLALYFSNWTGRFFTSGIIYVAGSSCPVTQLIALPR